ncbi:hypothetical protein ACLOJK_035466 [Asimina triloba]
MEMLCGELVSKVMHDRASQQKGWGPPGELMWGGTGLPRPWISLCGGTRTSLVRLRDNQARVGHTRELLLCTRAETSCGACAVSRRGAPAVHSVPAAHLMDGEDPARVASPNTRESVPGLAPFLKRGWWTGTECGWERTLVGTIRCSSQSSAPNFAAFSQSQPFENPESPTYRSQIQNHPKSKHDLIKPSSAILGFHACVFIHRDGRKKSWDRIEEEILGWDKHPNSCFGWRNMGCDLPQLVLLSQLLGKTAPGRE